MHELSQSVLEDLVGFVGLLALALLVLECWLEGQVDRVPVVDVDWAHGLLLILDLDLLVGTPGAQEGGGLSQVEVVGSGQSVGCGLVHGIVLLGSRLGVDHRFNRRGLLDVHGEVVAFRSCDLAISSGYRVLDAVGNSVLDKEPVVVLLDLQLVREVEPPGVLVGVVPRHQSADGLVRGTSRNRPIMLAEPLEDRVVDRSLFVGGGLAISPLVGARSRWILLATDGVLHKTVSRVPGGAYVQVLRQFISVSHSIIIKC